ncbi:MAG: formate/nitrite transporter family protein [Clostridia bacterium]|nr:formate/nitrite transporter family protein [Clostridia bacterium]
MNLTKKITSQIFEGILAGLMITIGCCVYLACAKDGGIAGKVAGAVIFSVGLLAVCYFGFSLYTGRIGFIIASHSKDDVSALLLGLLGNVIAAAVFGIAIGYAIPSLRETALAACNARLEQEWWQTLLRGIGCGILMYVAVGIFKEKKSPLGIVFAIPAFILAGFEHSIADMGYFAIAGSYSAKAFGFIWIVILGNSIGAWIIPLLRLVKPNKDAIAPQEQAMPENQTQQNQNQI